MWANWDNRARRLGILDTKLAQAAAIFFALTIVKLYPALLGLNIWWYAGLAALCSIRPVITFYCESDKI